MGQKSARIRCRLGFAGYEARSRAYLDTSDVLIEAPRTTPQLVVDQNGLKDGRLEAWKAAILDQKSARIRCRLGFAGYEVRSKVYVDIS